MQPIDPNTKQTIFTVARLNREVRFLIEGSFDLVWIEGEISNFVAAQSGHWYFSLKDADAQVKCAMFRSFNRHSAVLPKEGMHVLMKARVSLYEGRGEFQLIAEQLEEAGEGLLRQQFETLKKRLSEAGLFSNSHKKPLPSLPKTIGVITSPTGAAIRDILHVLERRFSCGNVLIYPCLVQGEFASTSIANAIQVANRRSECDVLILARGGGSLEDLWAFNEEKVAFAIYHSQLPIITGIGHEIDFTIADFVADQRAPTPSVAAELVAPSCEELLESLNHKERHISRLIKQILFQFRQTLSWTEKHLNQQHPKRRLAEQSQRLDLAEASFIRLQSKLLEARKTLLSKTLMQINVHNPRFKIKDINERLKHDLNYFHNCITKTVHRYQNQVIEAGAKLDALSPLSTLKRGFAIATSEKNQGILTDTNEIEKGDKIRIRLLQGELITVVEKVLK